MLVSNKENKMQLILSAFDFKILDDSVKYVIDVVKKTGVIVKGPVPLPTSIRKLDVLKSPHIYKRFMEHYEKRIYKRLICIFEVNSKTIDALMKIELHNGVDVSIKQDKL